MHRDDLDDVIFDMGVGILAELSVVEAVKYGEERIGVLRRWVISSWSSVV